MRNTIKSFLFLTLILFLLGCKKETYNLNEAFTLKFNKSALINLDGDEYEIKFTKLVEDSRCPPGSTCFWEGEVAVRINLNNDTDFVIGDHTPIPSTAEYKNHTIHLLEVTYNNDKNFGKEKHCSIKLKVD